MRRFFIPPECISGDRAILTRNEAHHITTVLRLQPGSTVELFDGSGTVYTGRLEQTDSREVTVRILASRPELRQTSAPSLVLLQGMLKGKKMDLIVQKATEMGVHFFQPLLTGFSERHEPSTRQIERWQRITLAACKQCRRNRPMTIGEPVKLVEVALPKNGCGILLWEKEEQRALDSDIFAEARDIWLMLGPEGGFRQQEVEQARSSGFATYSLGRRILRAETAALASLAIVQFLLGELQPGVN
jgi:16S rRNA (uracil1498-N3)-methyltransferase